MSQGVDLGPCLLLMGEGKLVRHSVEAPGEMLGAETAPGSDQHSGHLSSDELDGLIVPRGQRQARCSEYPAHGGGIVRECHEAFFGCSFCVTL